MLMNIPMMFGVKGQSPSGGFMQGANLDSESF